MLRLFVGLGIVVAAGLSGCSGSRSERASTLAQGNTTWTADNCLDGQDMDAEDVDVARCPPLPEHPESVSLGADRVSLGAWEIGTTADGDRYKYGGLTSADGGGAVLAFAGGRAAVDAANLTCWAKGYYRLRRILQDPPAAWLALRAAGFQYRFFQFQTDLRNGTTGYRAISSYQDHLVKWVTVLDAAGACEQPTLGRFRAYAAAELARRGLPVPASPDGGADDAGADDAAFPDDAAPTTDGGGASAPDAGDAPDAGP